MSDRWRPLSIYPLLLQSHLSLNFLEQEGVEVLVLSDNIDRAAQKGFKV